MSDSLSPARQQRLLSDLHRVSAERAVAETDLTSRLTQTERELESAFAEEKARLEEQRDAERDRCEREFAVAVELAQRGCAAELAAAEADRDAAMEDIKSRFRRASEEVAEEFQDEKWHASAMFDAEKNSLGGELTPRLSFITERANRLSELAQENARWRKQLKLTGEAAPKPQFAIAKEMDPLPILENATITAVNAADELRNYRRRPLLKALWLVPLFAAAFVVLMLVGGVRYKIEVLSPAVLEGEGLKWLLISAGATVAFAILVYVARHYFRRHSARQMSRQLGAILAEADVVRQECEERESVVEARRLQQSKQKMKEQKDQLKQQFEQKAIDLARQGDQELREVERAYARRIDAAQRQSAARLAGLNEQYGPSLHGQENRFSKSLLARELKYRRDRVAFEEDREQAWRDLNAMWRDWMARLKTEVTEINIAAAERFPSWCGTDWQSWQPPQTVPGGMRFGCFQVDLSKIEGGVPRDERLRRLTNFDDVPSAIPADAAPSATPVDLPAATPLAAPMAIAVPPPSFTLPAVAAFPSFPSLLYKAQGSGRAKAVEALQAAMLRALTSLPAGKVRFTIIDPLGLGENFAGFMHLADYDEQLVTSRIWTEQEHIQQKLADLTEHLENVIQTYLRNEFETIEAYNQHAGEVAEPFRILVVADFPANFNEAAFRRLVSIAQTGPRCGVFPLITVDAKKPMPHGCDMKDLERHCNVIKWGDNKFIWLSEAFRDYPLTLDAPPPAEEFSKIVHIVGKHAKNAGRVEVPFRYIAATGDEMWTGDCGKELDAPLGRAGATKLQHMRLGQGTSQHVVIAGKTGSGKSTLLHVLITSMALRYSPDQVQFYLVDFKKGVEFKTYATHKLPHARVVAVESEREFGLSVLERLDVELKNRGDQFRALGVQDLNSYRKQTKRPLPRILLLIDEFQELFVEDDRVGTQSALLLDRLVRQGRAFGIHILLGSQTLGGAYSLARSTLGQMAVRIALECSEADASMILSEGNTAARLLSRPGEAIYNDANGRVEGNKPFQVAWLPDEVREGFLADVRELAAAREYPVEPQIVFEGNAPADLAGNHLLAGLLAADSWPERQHAVTAWFGDPVAIKDPTAAIFRRQGGSNLLIVGQREEGALGVLAAALVSLAAQHRPEDEAGGWRLEAGGREMTNAGATAGLRATGGLPASASAINDEEERAFAAEFGLDGVSSNGSPQTSTLDVPIDPDPAAARFYILDGTRGDSPLAALFPKLADALPHQLRVAGWRDVQQVLAEVNAIVQRRMADNTADGAAVYLVIANLGRFRELRRDEGDFGYGGFGDEKKTLSPAQQLLNILKEGAGLGVHVLCWSDTAGNLGRSFDRQALREFELRVLFQMGADDSSNLIDDPAANKLGQFRALFYSEEQGGVEKFRPYDVPEEEWLASVAEQFAQRVPVGTPS